MTSSGRSILAAALLLDVLSCEGASRGFGDTQGSFGEGGADADPACDRVFCSRDLKRVLRTCDGVERVVETCGEGLGCGDGRCVDACLGAELSKGSLGCEFATLPPDDRRWNLGDCFVAMIANTWDRPITLRAELGGAPLDVTRSIYSARKEGPMTAYTRIDGPIPSGEVALVFLSQQVDSVVSNTACPAEVTVAFTGDPIRHGTAKTRAFRLETDAPVSAYSLFPYGGAVSYFPTATLLLPVSSWGTNYLAVNPATVSVEGASFSPANRVVQIVANEDGTEVRIRPTVDVTPGHEVTAAAAGVTTTWTLGRGQAIQLNQHKDLSGSVLEANKPIGVFGGQECMNVPVELGACDMLQQQIPPLAQWGFEYALVPPPPRDGSASEAMAPVPWSFVGAVDGTVLVYDPARPHGAPETLAAGQHATFLTDTVISVRSQDADHPFHASVLMTGQGYGGLGDPDFVNVVPADQFLDRYVFFTDFTFADTGLTLVRRKSARGFLPVSLACAGEVTGWRAIGARVEFEYAWVRLTRQHAGETFGEQRSCGYGRQSAESEGPFAVTVWGTDSFASYGYPGGTSLRPISNVRIPVR